jgi:sugar phosphate isomerase/epimerase
MRAMSTDPRPYRRSFLSHLTSASALAAGASLGAAAAHAAEAKPADKGNDAPGARKTGKAAPTPKPALFKISLAEWSLHKALFAKEIDNLDFAKVANGLGIDGIEYVNQFWKDKAKDRSYLAELKRRAAGEGVWSVLIMIDGEGNMGAKDEAKRKATVENHKKWVEAAAYLGCHSIRVNAGTDASFDEGIKLAADGLRKLGEYADPLGISVIVENHGGFSSNAQWLTSVMKEANHARVGTLPDFGNFRIKEGEEYDRYKGVEELMPYARSVSAKTHEFDKKGNEAQIDYLRMMKIVTAAGYHGYVGIEYEGKTLTEMDGIVATKKLLERVRGRLAVG